MTAAWVRPPVIDVLEPGYADLFERVVKASARDERVRALWLSGSLARGTADRASDLDVLVAVRDDAHDDFAAGWADWLASITPTVIARPLPFLPGSFYSVTPERMRLDVVVERVSQLPTSFFRERTVVFDRDALDATVPPPAPPAPPDKGRVAELVEEFFRDHGMFNVVVDREDWLLGLEALHVMRTLLYRLYVEANAPLPASGVKRWTDKLTPGQRAVLEGLPTGSASRDELVRAIDTTACTFVREARPICARLGVPWPDALERATVSYLRAHGLPALEGAE